VDIVSAQATKSGQTFRFQMSLAAPIPANPATPPATNQIHWGWPLDTDSTTFPAGDPFPVGPGQSRPAEFGITVVWDGSSFSASLTDRRPLLHGGEAVVTPLAFTISGAEVVTYVGANLLDDPSNFSWGAVTFYWSSLPGATAGVHFVDSPRTVLQRIRCIAARGLSRSTNSMQRPLSTCPGFADPRRSARVCGAGGAVEGWRHERLFTGVAELLDGVPPPAVPAVPPVALVALSRSPRQPPAVP